MIVSSPSKLTPKSPSYVYKDSNAGVSYIFSNETGFVAFSSFAKVTSTTYALSMAKAPEIFTVLEAAVPVIKAV